MVISVICNECGKDTVFPDEDALRVNGWCRVEADEPYVLCPLCNLARLEEECNPSSED